VDRVIHNRGEVNPKTKEKVLKILEEMDYQPNILASTLASKKQHRFAILIPDAPPSGTYWSQPLVGIEDATRELLTYGVQIELFKFSESSPESFKNQAEKIIESTPEGVVLAPFFSRESLVIAEKLEQKAIPYVFIDSNINTEGNLSFVGQNSYQCGSLAGHLFDYLIPDGKRILIIHLGKELDNLNHHSKREAGLKSYFSSPERVEKKQISTLNVDITPGEDFYPLIDDELNKRTDIAGIFISNSKAHWVAKYLDDKQIKHIKLIGNDLVPANADFLRKGVIDFLICQRPIEQGYQAVMCLFQHIIMKKQVNPTIYTSIDILTKENLDFYKEFNQTNYGSN